MSVMATFLSWCFLQFEGKSVLPCMMDFGPNGNFLVLSKCDSIACAHLCLQLIYVHTVCVRWMETFPYGLSIPFLERKKNKLKDATKLGQKNHKEKKTNLIKKKKILILTILEMLGWSSLYVMEIRWWFSKWEKLWSYAIMLYLP